MTIGEFCEKYYFDKVEIVDGEITAWDMGEPWGPQELLPGSPCRGDMLQLLADHESNEARQKES